ncbi:hypothetical protein AG1IA_06453 [Rhizoctonia solani AG-1 IA]|uniref:Uncharacterized protein n=1 Tax=Thanatephorus cucumeris (strain AG1-IA) TaxID=983506 RepID=L8WRZ8_THACA|nr:hypothetical protein AG1IA_06453 [Rhizoctonia solani AG-1 IA]
MKADVLKRTDSFHFLLCYLYSCGSNPIRILYLGAVYRLASLHPSVCPLSDVTVRKVEHHSLALGFLPLRIKSRLIRHKWGPIVQSLSF